MLRHLLGVAGARSGRSRTPAVDRTLERAILRNVPCEIVLDAGRTDECRLRTRFLGRDETGIELDWPERLSVPDGRATEHAREAGLVDGAPLEIVFSLGGARRSFRTTLVRLPVRIALAGAHGTIGLVVADPTEVIEAQRRRSFRLGLGGRGITVPVHAATIGAGSGAGHDAAAAPLDAPILAARLVDLSPDGMAIVVRDGRAVDTSVGASFFCSLDCGDGLLRLLADVRHRRPLGAPGDARDDVRLGLQFRAWPDERAFARTRHVLQRELVRMQRSRVRVA